MHRFVRQAILFACSVLLAGDIWPANWELVAMAEDRSAWLFLDHSSINREKETVTARLMLEYAEDQAGIPETHDEPYVAVRNRIRFNCAKELFLPLEQEYLYSEEGFVAGGDLSPEGWRPIFPGSLVESAYGILCGESQAPAPNQPGGI